MEASSDIFQGRATNLPLKQLMSYPLTPDEIQDVVNKVKNFTDEDVENIILFYYPEDWEKGEVIWTPDPKESLIFRKNIPVLQQ